MGTDVELPKWPDRAVMRFIVLFHTRLAVLGSRLVGGSLVRWILLAPLIRQSLADDAASMTTPGTMTVNALAASMSIPYETARRQVAILVADGFCERTEKGVGLSSDLRSDPGLATMIGHVGDEFQAFLGSLRAMQVPLPAGKSVCPFDRAVFIRTAMDLALVGVEYWRQAYAMPVDMLTFGAVSIENCYPFTADRAACRRYGAWDNPPPEAIKRPVSGVAIAAVLDIPYPTIWRSIRRLREDGRLLVTPQGLVSCNGPTDAIFRTARHQMIEYFRSRLGRLAHAGFDLDAMAQASLRARGALARDLHGDPFLTLPPPASALVE